MTHTDSDAGFLFGASQLLIISAPATITSLLASSFANRSSKVATNHIEEVVIVT